MAAAPLEGVYAVVFLDAIHYHVRSEGQIVKKAVYIAIGIDLDGRKDVLGMWVGENESAKFWATVLNGLKNRGVEDIFIACTDNLAGFDAAIHATFPQTEIQNCILHQLRNSSRYVSYKDLKALMADLKAVYTGLRYATRLYVGDYHASNSMAELVSYAGGIRRMAVCRADVDNLGAIFLSGFVQAGKTDAERNRFVTLSRTATLSRQLSLFFKYHINGILSGELSEADGPLPVSIVYSGGDDLFLLGAWDGVLQAIQRIQRAFERYTGGSIHLSGGLGLFGESYPIRRSALLTEELVEEAKSMDGKNALSLFAPAQGHNYSWATFSNQVLEEKLSCIRNFFDSQRREDVEARGMAFLYRLLELLRGCDEQISLARIVYLLVRMEPEKRAAAARMQYSRFSKNIMQWCRQQEHRRQLITAIYLYVYEERGGEAQ